MAREAELFDAAGGSVVRGYLLMKQDGRNVPPAWIDRARVSRRKRQANVVAAMKSGGAVGVLSLEDWEKMFQKECFYYGIRCLMELERTGKTTL